MSASDKKKLRKEQAAAALTEKQKAQQKEAKQLKRYTMTFVIVMVLVVAIAASSLGINWYNNSGIPARNTVALKLGDTELSNVDLNYYFIDTINSFYSSMYNTYGSYTTLYTYYMYGLDMSTSLSSQVYNSSTGDTWADYFVDSAISSASTTYAIYNEALKNGYELSDEYQAELTSALAYYKTLASYYGYSDLDSYLQAMYGVGATEESFVNYYTVSLTAEAYYNEYSDSLLISSEDIDTYNQENYNTFSTFNFSYFYISADNYLPEKEAEESTDETTETTEAAEVEYTDEEIAAAIAAAKADADALAACDGVLMMNKAIGQLSWATESSAATSKTSIAFSSLPSLYSEWLADTARAEGDTTVVEYDSSDEDEDADGYYVVIFEGRNDYNELMRSARHILVKFEGGTTENGTTTYSEEEKATAYAEAEALYNEWLSGETVDEASFAALCTSETSDDTGSNTNGGLYTNIYAGQMVTNFNDWVFDESRQHGDHAIIETEIGYHIMFFVEEQDQSYREYAIDQTLRSEAASEWNEQLLEKLTVTEGNFSYMSLDLIISPATSS